LTRVLDRIQQPKKLGKMDCEEGAGELFKGLFGGYSGSLSLFTNNPYQRKKNGGDDALVKPALKNDDRSERKSKKTPLKKDVDVAAERLENGSIAHRKKEKKKEEEEKKGEKKKSSRGELEGGFVPASKKESNGNEEVAMQESVEKKGEKRRKKETGGAQNAAVETRNVENGSSTEEKENHVAGEAKERSNHREKVIQRDVGKETHAQDPGKEEEEVVEEGTRKQNPSGREKEKRLLGEKRKLALSENDLEEKFEKRLRALDATVKESSKSSKGREVQNTMQTRELLQDYTKVRTILHFLF
jgi:hypothetical protein